MIRLEQIEREVITDNGNETVKGWYLEDNGNRSDILWAPEPELYVLVASLEDNAARLPSIKRNRDTLQSVKAGLLTVNEARETLGHDRLA